MVAANPSDQYLSTGIDPPPAFQQSKARETTDADGVCRSAQLAVRAGCRERIRSSGRPETNPLAPLHLEPKRRRGSGRAETSVPHSNALYKGIDMKVRVQHHGVAVNDDHAGLKAAAGSQELL
jgi:hypothetical protein